MIATSVSVAAAPSFTDEFPIEKCAFKASGANPYFRLTPGRQAYFSNQRCVAAGDCDELEELWITVTHRTRDIRLREDGVTRTITTRVVQEFETADGELVEISRNFFAVCQTYPRRLLLRRGGRHIRGRPHRQSRRGMARRPAGRGAGNHHAR
jgi:hypothetical protein